MTDRAQLQEQEAACNTVADLATLIDAALEDPTDREYAEELATRAEGLCVEVEDTVGYAGILHRLGRDAADIRSALEEAEMDCQFTKQFVALARGFRDYCDDEAKMRELMEQAEEFCMTDEEQLDLGDGFQSLLGDAQRAAACYEKGLAGVQDRDALIALAEKFASELNNPELAKTVYARAEEKLTSGNDLRKFAQSMLTHLKDEAAVGEVYLRASERLSSVNDLINLAEDSLKINLRELAEQLYRKVLSETSDCAQILKLIAPLQEMDDAQALLGEALQRAGECAGGSNELLEVANLAQQAAADTERVRELLQRAEEQVTSLGELTAVCERVAELAGDDAAWKARLDEKMEKRQANQARYTEFQDLEQKSDEPLQFIQLALRIMDELDDTFYARKLLDTAQQLMEAKPGDLNLCCLLARTLDGRLQESDAAHALLQQAAERAEDFPSIRRLAQTLSGEMQDKAAGQARVRDWYVAWQEKLDTEDAYGHIRMARAVLGDLEDAAMALGVLDRIPASSRTPLVWAQMGLLARDAGDETRAGDWFTEAMKAAGDCEQSIGLAQLLCQEHIEPAQVRSLYEAAAPEEPEQRLRWIEGILEVFHDPDWGAQAYREMEALSMEPPLQARLQWSRESRLGRFLVR